MTIPASLFVQVIPGVISGGGNALAINGVMLTTSTRIPIGTVQNFPNAPAVAKYFGPNSAEASAATIYFNGYIGRTAVPGAMLMAQYPKIAVGAYLRGGNVSTMTLAQLQALTGSLDVTVDGAAWNAASINLSSATSFSSAATIIASGLSGSPPADATCTLGEITGTTLTVAGTVTGSFEPGMGLTGAGVTAGSVILSQLTGTTGGLGTYQLSQSSSVGSGEELTGAFEAPTVTYDSVSGAFIIASAITGAVSTLAFATGTLAPSLFLNAATGAVLSQGAVATTPAAFMDGLIALTQNWATFWTGFDPDGGSGNMVKLAFAAWANGQNNRYAYLCWDTDPTPRNELPAQSSLGYLVNTEFNYSGTCLISELADVGYAAFVAGCAASVNYNQTNGRVTFAYLSQSGLIADVTDAQTFTNLAGNPQVAGSFGNGYNCYAATATANQNFTNFQRGTISGPYEWLDSFLNQVYLSNQLQLSLMTLLTTVGSIPYNPAGAALIEGALSAPLQQFLNFGGARTGVALSAQQIEEINTLAGASIAGALQTQGYYILVGVATSQVRQSRASPPIMVFYVDGESVQAISLSSTLVQ
jgi:hypothetical protein